MSTSKAATGLRFAAALSTNSDTRQAVAEVCRQTVEHLGGTPNLGVVFASHHHGPDFEPVAAGICDQTGVENLLGCTGESIVGGAREVEGQPAISLAL